MTTPPITHARIRILDKATLVCTPGVLEGEALARSLKARLHRAYLHDAERYRNWKDGRPLDPELVFWTHDEPS